MSIRVLGKTELNTMAECETPTGENTNEAVSVSPKPKVISLKGCKLKVVQSPKLLEIIKQRQNSDKKTSSVLGPPEAPTTNLIKKIYVTMPRKSEGNSYEKLKVCYAEESKRREVLRDKKIKTYSKLPPSNQQTSSSPSETYDKEIQCSISLVDNCCQTDDNTSTNPVDWFGDSPGLDESLINYLVGCEGTLIPELKTIPASPQTTQTDPKVQFFYDLRSAKEPDQNGNLPIHVSVLQNNLTLCLRYCYILKARHEGVNLPNAHNETPLQLAVVHERLPEIIDLLLQQGASLSDLDENGNTIFHVAVQLDFVDGLMILIEHAEKKSVNLDQFNYEGHTPLMICCMKNHVTCARLLLDHGANPNVRDLKSGRTALFHAAENHDEEMVELLIRRKADTKIRNFFGTSPHDAMYELEDVPENIKSMVLKRKLKSWSNVDEEKKKGGLRIVSTLRKIDVEATRIKAKTWKDWEPPQSKRGPQWKRAPPRDRNSKPSA